MKRALHLASAPPRHEDVFMTRYERLSKWALHLSDNDKEAAEDLIQEAFVQFTFSNKEIHTIRNLDAYLFGLLRIIHLSQLRRATVRAHLLRSVVDYDSAIMGLRTADHGEQLTIRDELHQICQYACNRKDTSKAGSVLLLRFFLGYYPSEIAQILNCSRPAVEERLRIARSEAKARITNPDCLKIIGEPTSLNIIKSDSNSSTDAFLSELHRVIFLSCRGNCLTRKQWQHLYRDDGGIDCHTLAHLVSCQNCLDVVSKLLGLPLLAQRHPMDTLGKDTPPKGGGNDGRPPGNIGGSGSTGEIERLRQKAREVFEHVPQELCVSVNGFVQGTQKVTSSQNEQTLNVANTIEFVEVFSEQGVRLLLVSGEELSAARRADHLRYELSDGRTLNVNLRVSYPTSFLQIVYQNPTWEEERTPTELAALTNADDFDRKHSPLSIVPGDARKISTADSAELLAKLVRLWQRLTGRDFWLRPGIASAILSLCLIAALLFLHFRAPKVSASEVLHRSIDAEQSSASDTATVVHRVINFEEREEDRDGVLVRRRIESWQSALQGITVRRVYDEKNQLIISDLTHVDGRRFVLSPGSEVIETHQASPSAGELLAMDAPWRLHVSAVDYLDLIGRTDGMTIEEHYENYVISHRADSATESVHGVLEATLVVSKATLRGVELRLRVKRQDGTREYRLSEAGFERRPHEAIAPSVFQLSPVSAPVKTRTWPEGNQPGSVHDSTSAAPPTHTSNVIASPELEVEINYLLHQIRANLGEQITLERTVDNRLRVEALVDTDRRKAEILDALRPIQNNPAVNINVNTVTEVLKRRRPDTRTPTSVLEIEIGDEGQKVDSELRRFFATRRGVERSKIDEEVRQFSNRVMSSSRQSIQHASALKRLVDNFSLQESRMLNDDARLKLLVMVRDHAQAYQANIRLLKEELRQFSSASSFDGSGEARIRSDAELARAVERLLRLSYSNDTAIRSAFALSAQGQSLDAIKSREFWISLNSAAELAEAIQRAY